jgi:hypothetical protein
MQAPVAILRDAVLRTAPQDKVVRKFTGSQDEVATRRDPPKPPAIKRRALSIRLRKLRGDRLSIIFMVKK